MVLGSEVIVCLDDLMEVGFHQLEHNVDVIELPSRRRKHYVLDFHDIGVAHQPQKLDLAQDAGGVGDVLEDVVDLLDRHLLSGEGVDRGANDPVAALSDDLQHAVPAPFAVLCEEFDFLRRLNGGASRLQL